jgi:hypothetical protein
LFKFACHLLVFRARRGGECLVVRDDAPLKHVRGTSFERVQDPDGFNLHMKDVKNHKGEQDYKAFYPILADDPDNLLKLFDDYRTRSPVALTADGFLLINSDGSPLDASTMYAWTKEAFALIGLDIGDKTIGASSFRAGAATESARLGFAIPQLMQVGDWKSEASLRHYIQPAPVNVVESVARLAEASTASLFAMRAALAGNDDGSPFLSSASSNRALAQLIAALLPVCE